MKGMAWLQKLGICMVLLIIVSKSEAASSDDLFHCENTVKNWAEVSNGNGEKEDKLTLKDLLFFLHVPRTGGRAYFHCFLRKLYTSNQECPRSYDKLHFNPRKPNCRLMVTHDDYSLMANLPKDRTSVVTILRNPIDRIFSTYEFSVEVAARFLVHPNLTSVRDMSRRIAPKSRGVSTLDIWPWKYLVPWMREDLFSRRDVREFVRSNWTKNSSNPYDMEDMVMPLHTFINDPIAHDIIHNGATFQVAGLTNNSYVDGSHQVRHCVRKHPALGQFVLEIAKNRLDHMLYVGLTEDHKESATIFANMVGAQVLSQSEALNSPLDQVASIKTNIITDEELDGQNQDQHSISNQEVEEGHTLEDADKKNQSMTVGQLMDAYEVCTSSLRKSQGARRAMSLKRISPANFSKEARLLVPEEVIQEILSLNSLDVELYKHAQDIFLQQQRHLMQKNEDILNQQHVLLPQKEIQGSDGNHENCGIWKFFSLAVLGLLFIVVVFLTVTTRRTPKIKV